MRRTWEDLLYRRKAPSSTFPSIGLASSDDRRSVLYDAMLGELTDREIETTLRDNVIGRIGCHAYGHTYVVPITYAYDGTYVYAHTTVGMKLHMMRDNPHLCFEIDNMDDLANWRSVIAWGTFEELRGSVAEEAMQFLVDKIELRLTGPPGASVHPKSWTERVVVFRIKLEQKTGRFERRK